MIVSKKTLSMAVGAVTGGFITDDEGLMTAVGMTVGGAVGLQWKFQEPEEMFKIKKYKQVFNDANIAIPDGDKEVIERFEKKVATGVYDKRIRKVKKGTKPDPIDFDNLEETLNDVTFKEVMKNGTPEEKMKIRDYLRNPGGFETLENLEEVVLNDILKPNDRRVYNSIVGEMDQDLLRQERLTAIEEFFEEKGYTGDELETRVKLATAGLEDHDQIIIDRTRNTLKIGEKSAIKVADNIGGALIHFDGNNASGARRTNIFGQYIAGHSSVANKNEFFESNGFKLHVDNILESLQVTDDTVKEVFRANARKWMTEGMTIDELQMFSQHSPVLRGNEKIENLIDGALQWLPEDTGEYRRGIINIEDLTNHARTVSNVTAAQTTLRIGEEGKIQGVEQGDTLGPFKGLDTNIGGDGESDLTRMNRFLNDATGISNIKKQVSINHPTSYNVIDPTSIAVADYSDKARISPYRPVRIQQNSNAKLNGVDSHTRTALAMLDALGILPEEFQTEATTRVLSVDQDSANAVLRSAGINTQLGDGFSVSTVSFAQAFTQRQYGSVVIKGNANEIGLSNRITDILRNQETYNVGLKSQIITPMKLKGFDTHLFLDYINQNRSLWGTDKEGRKELFQKFRKLDLYDEDAFNKLLEDSLNKKKTYREKKLQSVGRTYNSAMLQGMIDSISKGEYYAKFLESVENAAGLTKRIEALEALREQLVQLEEFDSRPLYQDLLNRVDDMLDDPIKATSQEFHDVNKIIKERNSAIRARVSGVLGMEQIDADGFGKAVMVPKTLTGKVQLLSVGVVENLDGTKEITLHLDSEAFQREGDTYKYYGSGSKLNQKALNEKRFNEIAEALLGDSSTSLRGMSDQVNFSVIAESGSTGQKEAMKLYDILTNPQHSTTDILEALRAEDTSVWKDTDKAKGIREALDKLKFSRGIMAGPTADLVEFYRQGDLSDGDVQARVNRYTWGLTQLLNATTEGKPTENAVKGLLIDGVGNINQTFEDVLLQVKPPETLLSIPGLTEPTKQRLKDNLHIFSDPTERLNNLDLATEIQGQASTESALHFRAQYDMFGPGQLTRNALTGNIYTPEMLESFTFANDIIGVSRMSGTKERDADVFTGAGGTEKRLSHFAIQAAVDKGFSREQIDLFSSVDTKVNYDYAAMHATYQEPKGTTLDKLLFRMVENDPTPADKMKSIVEELMGRGADPREIRAKLESRIKGVIDPAERNALSEMLKEVFEHQDGSAKPFAYFALPDQDALTKTTSVRQIPIYLGNTDMGGQTIAQNGTLINSTLSNAHLRVINAAIDHMTEGSEKEDITIKGITTPGTRSKLIEATTDVVNFYRDYSVSSNNSMAKNVFSRTADNSAYLKVVAGSGNNFEKEVSEAVENGRSVVGVSRKRATDYLRGMGVKISNDKDLDAFLDADGYIKRDASSNKRMIFMNSREPTITASGFRMVHVKVMDGLQDSEIAIGADDLYYTRLMTGDMDNDNVYLVGMKKLLSPEEYKDLEDLYKRQSEVDKELIKVAKYLGVKSKGKDVQFDFTELVKEATRDPGKFGLTAEDLDAIKVNKVDINHPSAVKVLDALENANDSRDQATSMKSGLRKIVTPTVTTMVKTILDNPLFHQEKDALTKGTAMLLGNFLVENLLKSSHVQTGQKSPLDELLDSFKDFAKHSKDEARREEFVKRLSKNLDDMRAQLDDSSFSTPGVKDKIEKGFQHIKNTAQNMNVEESANVLAINQQLNKLQRKAMTPGGTPSANLAKIGNIYQRYNPSKAADMDMRSVSWINAGVDKAQTTRAGFDLIKKTVIDNIKENKMTLAIGAGALGLTALITQKGPDFDASNGKVSSGEASAMTLTPHTLADEQGMLDRLGGERSAYITPPIDTARFREQAMNAYGGYHDAADRSSDNLNRAIFGNNISAVRVDTTYGYNS